MSYKATSLKALVHFRAFKDLLVDILKFVTALINVLMGVMIVIGQDSLTI